MKALKEFFLGKDTKDYWDEKATILEYAKSINGKGKVNKALLAMDTRQLYLVAEREVGRVDFDALTNDIPDYFVELEDRHIIHAVEIGILGALIAWEVDRKGKKLETFLDKHLPKLLKEGLTPEEYQQYDVNTPFDIKKGNQHRYDLFHDLLSFWQKVPGDFMVNGVEVHQPDSLVSLKELLMKTYSIEGNTQVENFIRIVKHCIVHFSKDISTSDGLPILGSSLFTRFEKSATNSCGYSTSNVVMDILGREYGSINTSDFASIVVMKTFLKLYIANSTPHNEASKRLFENQLNVMTYGTCMIIQLVLMMRGKTDNPQKNIDGGKLNIIMASLFAKNCMGIIKLLSREDEVIKQHYEEIIRYYDSIIASYNITEVAIND